MKDVFATPIIKSISRRQKTLRTIAKTLNATNPIAAKLAWGEILFLQTVAKKAIRL